MHHVFIGADSRHQGGLLRGRRVLFALMLAMLVGGVSSHSVSAAPVEADSGHVVQPGDTLAAIARRYGVSTNALVQANAIANPNLIYIGQNLVIPGASGSTGVPAAPKPPSQAPATGTYIVQAGDTLGRIAARFGTTVRNLMQLNGLSNPDFIWVGQRLRVSGAGSAPAAGAPVTGSTAGRWIDVDLSRQRLTAYQGNTAVFSTLISGGLPRTPTVVGRFQIQTKLRSTRMSGPGYDLPGVPYTMYFYRGYAIHGTYWHNNFGSPMSHGCVNMSTEDAAWLYSWASIGTAVVTHW